MKNQEKELQIKELKLQLTDFLQENTDLAERLENDFSQTRTDNNPEGEYAQIEKWLNEIDDEKWENLIHLINSKQ